MQFRLIRGSKNSNPLNGRKYNIGQAASIIARESLSSVTISLFPSKKTGDLVARCNYQVQNPYTDGSIRKSIDVDIFPFKYEELEKGIEFPQGRAAAQKALNLAEHIQRETYLDVDFVRLYTTVEALKAEKLRKTAM